MAAFALSRAASLPGRCSVTCARRCRGAWRAATTRPLLRCPRAQQPSDEDRARIADAEAMQEAMELYKEAQDLSQRQVLQELMQMEVSDMAYYDEDDEDSTVPPNQRGPHPGSIRRVPVAASAPAFNAQEAVSPLQSFWVEQGLTAHVAYGVARDMVEAQSRFCDVTQLAVQVQRLGRVIPGRVQDMVARDWHILESTPNTVAQHFVQLVQLFPNSLDVSELACKQPKLLYCDDLVGQFEGVVSKLVQLHPSHNRDEARALLVENPELIFRMRYYMHVRTLDELPIELQNLMVYTGQGLHQLHQMYSDSISPRFL